MAPAPSMGVSATRMEPEKDRRSPGGNRGSRKPMDKDGTRAARRRIARAVDSGGILEVVKKPKRVDTQLL